MLIDYRQISSETLKNLGLEKGTDVVQLSIILTELCFLMKLMCALVEPMPQFKEKMGEKEHDKYRILTKANLEMFQILSFLVIGKSVEAWKMIDSDRFKADYFESLIEEGREFYKKIENNFKKPHKNIRNQLAFHYHVDFKKYFNDEEKGIRFPDINSYSNLRMSGTTIFSDIYMQMAIQDFKGNVDLNWLELHKEIMKFTTPIFGLIYDLINHIVGDKFSEIKNVEVPDLEAGDTFLNNYFWEIFD